MIIGKVKGSVVATRKHDKLIGSKFLVIEPLSSFSSINEKIDSANLVAVDHVGAGIGDIVLVSLGSAARLACDDINTPCDAAVVGIVDDGTDWSK